MFQNPKKKFILSRKRIFQSHKKRSKSFVGPGVRSDVDCRRKLEASLNHSENSWQADKNLGNDSKNELLVLQKQGGNKVISDKECDIKIYNEKYKKRNRFSEGEKVHESTSRIINKLSGSSIIIVYENGLQNKNFSSKMGFGADTISNESFKILSSLANHQKCSGDVTYSEINFTTSSSNKKLEINPSFPLSNPVSDKKKIIIQCCSSKKDENDDEGETRKTRMKLIPPNELSEPKCLKIVKKAVSNGTDLTHDLSNIMTGGRLIKTLKSFLGDHNSKEVVQTSYVEIVKKLSDSGKKHKILIFKRQIEKCNKCKQEEKISGVKPESNIIRLTVKKVNKMNFVKNMGDMKVNTQRENKHSKLIQSLENCSTVENSDSYKSDRSKNLSLLQNSLSPDSNVNILVTSTMNELTGTLNGKNNTKLSEEEENINNKSPETNNNTVTNCCESLLDSYYQRSSSLKKLLEKTQVRRKEFCGDSPVAADTQESNNDSWHRRKSQISVIHSPETVTESIENYDPTSCESETTHPAELRNRYQSEELCHVYPEESKIDLTEIESVNTQPSRRLEISNKKISRCASEKKISVPNFSKSVSAASDMSLENDTVSAVSIFEPVHDTTIPNHTKMPTLENDATFLQLFEHGRFARVEAKDFLADPSAKCMKADYYSFKRSFAAPMALDRLDSNDSIQKSGPRSEGNSKAESESNFKQEEILNITASEDSIANSSQITVKFNQPNKFDKQSVARDNSDYLKLDFLDFGINKQLDQFLAQSIEQNLNLKKQDEEKPSICSYDQQKKKKSFLWRKTCKLMKPSHIHCRKFV